MRPERGRDDGRRGDRPSGSGTANRFSDQVRMPTPSPGTWVAPDDYEDGPPEAFTLWIFDELADGWLPFLGSGRIVGGPHLTLSGHISKTTVPVTGGDPPGPRGGGCGCPDHQRSPWKGGPGRAARSDPGAGARARMLVVG